MNARLALCAQVLCALFAFHDSHSAHGGTYRGPGDTVPPGLGGNRGGGGSNGPAPAPGGPTGPTTSTPVGTGLVPPFGTPGASPQSSSTGAGSRSTDLTVWSFWWEFNKEPYLELKNRIHTDSVRSGSDTFFIGRGAKEEARDTLAPTERQIRSTVVPALLEALATETNNDIVTGAMIALAKIGDVRSESGASRFEEVIATFLDDANQEIRETAAVALGILANEASIPTLTHLLQDTAHARQELVRRAEVDYRTRAFAAYGLALVGARTADESRRQEIVRSLVSTLESDDTRSRDLQVACLIALGLVPLQTVDAHRAEDREAPAPPWASRIALLEYLLDYLADDEHHDLVRAHVPTALARLLEGHDPRAGLRALDAEAHDTWRRRVVEDLLGRLDRTRREPNEVLQSCILALGRLGTNGAADATIRSRLASVPRDVSDQQARNFSMIAMGQVGGRSAPAGSEASEGLREAGNLLLTQLVKGKSTVRPWAGLGIGVLCDLQKRADGSDPILARLGEALRASLEVESDKSKLAAFAIAAGIMRDAESGPILLDHLEATRDDEARGYIALALGLLGERSAGEPIGRIVERGKYRPALLEQAAIALGLLGDKTLVGRLTSMLESSKSLATQAAISQALGFIGDRSSIDPLVRMLRDPDLTDRARGFAAAALGVVVDKDPLPWNTRIGVGLNYRASTPTLNSIEGTGILNIL